MRERTDGELVRAVRRGERASFEPLVRRHQERLYRRALAILRDPDSAADAVQDAFVRAYTRLGECHDPDRFGAWIYRVLRNACFDELRSPRHRGEPIRPSLRSDAAGPARELERDELGRSIRGALDELTPVLREAFVLKHVEGLSYDEMKAATGVARSALKMRVKRARAQLQEILRPRLDPAPEPGPESTRTGSRRTPRDVTARARRTSSRVEQEVNRPEWKRP